MVGRKCEPGCTCFRHSAERKKNLSDKAKQQAIREGKERRSSQVKAVWSGRTEEERSGIAAKVASRTRNRRIHPDMIAKRAEGLRRSWQDKTPEERLARVLPALRARGRGASSIEIAVAAALEFLGIVYEREAVVMDRFVADFRIGDTLIIEVDGAYWHDAGKDADRDLLLSAAGYRVCRISEEEANACPVQAVARALYEWGNRRAV